MGRCIWKHPLPKRLYHVGFSITFIACGINNIASIIEQLHPNNRLIIEKSVQLALYIFSLAFIISHPLQDSARTTFTQANSHRKYRLK